MQKYVDLGDIFVIARYQLHMGHGRWRNQCSQVASTRRDVLINFAGNARIDTTPARQLPLARAD